MQLETLGRDALTTLGRDVAKLIAEYVAEESDHASLRLVCSMFNEVSREVIRERAAQMPRQLSPTHIANLVDKNQMITIRDHIIAPWVYISRRDAGYENINLNVGNLLLHLCEMLFNYSLQIPHEPNRMLDIDVLDSYYDELIETHSQYDLWKQILYTYIVSIRSPYNDLPYVSDNYAVICERCWMYIFGMRSRKVSSHIKLLYGYNNTNDIAIKYAAFYMRGHALRSKYNVQYPQFQWLDMREMYFMIMVDWHKSSDRVSYVHTTSYVRYLKPLTMDLMFPKLIERGKMIPFMEALREHPAQNQKRAEEWIRDQYPDGVFDDYADLTKY
jgi:hypothetical protein